MQTFIQKSIIAIKDIMLMVHVTREDPHKLPIASDTKVIATYYKNLANAINNIVMDHKS